MSSVDHRVVEMRFDKGQFEQGVNDTIKALENLKKGLALEGATKGLAAVNAESKRFSLSNVTSGFAGLTGVFGKVTSGFSGVTSGIKAMLNPIETAKAALKFDGATKGLQDINAQAQKVSFAPIQSGAAQATTSISAMQVAAVTAFATIVSRAADAGLQLAKSMSIQSTLEGFSDYELKVGATQTIMAGTGEGIAAVTANLKELDIYADQTIYSLSDMVSNIGKFTNAGVKLPVAVNAMKGISNVAALSGASTNEAARAMYNLGQAIGQGKVRLMDWKSVELANMGTKEFKEQLIDAGVAAGTLTKGMDGVIKSSKGSEVNFKTFSTTLQDEWLTSDVLTNTLGNYADETTALGKKAYAAAKDVKTFSMMMETLKAAAGTGWTDTFEIVIGTLPEATKLFTGMSNALGQVIANSADARNKLLGDWKELGGRTDLIEAFRNVWQGFMQVMGTIKGAFREIFPAKTGKDLAELTERFREFSEKLKMGDKTVDGLKRTFAGIFAVFSIVGQVISGAISGFGKLFSILSEGAGGAGGILAFTGSIGDFLVAINDMLKQSGVIKAFFEGLAELVSIPLKVIAAVGGAIAQLFAGKNLDGVRKVGDAFDRVGQRLEPLEAAAERVRAAFGRIGDFFRGVGEKIGVALTGVGDMIARAFSGKTFDKTLDVINTGLLGGILLVLKKFFSGGNVGIDFGGGLLGQAKDALAGVSQTMQSMQQNLKANILLKIGAAMLLMASAIAILASIDSKRLNSALVGMAAGIGIMGGAMIALVKVLSTIGLVHIYVITGAFLKMAAAMILVATALKILSSMDIGDTVQALIAMGGALGTIALAMRLMPKGMAKQAAGLIILGAALNVIAVAMKIFATLSWDEIARGLTALGGALAVIAAAMHLMPKNMLLQAASITILAVALNALGAAMNIFGAMDMETITRGLVAMAASLGLITLAMHLMPNGASMILQATGLTILAVALNGIGLALRNMGGMSIEEIAKGLVTMGASLLIIAGGMKLMTGALPGAAALVIVAGALAILTPVLVTLGSLEIETIAKALGTLAGVLIIFGGAGMLLAPLVPVLIGLSSALLILGAGFALAGVGALAMATAFGIVVTAGAAGIAILTGVLKVIVGAIVDAMKEFAKGIVEMAKIFAKAGPAFLDAISAIIKSFLDAIIKNAPKIAQAFTAILSSLLKVIIVNTPLIAKAIMVILDNILKLIVVNAPKFAAAFLAMLNAGLKVLVSAVPRMADAGLKIITGVLTAISNNIGKIVAIAAQLIVNFLNGIGNNIGKVIQAGVDLILKFIRGVTDAINRNSEALGRAGAELGVAIVKGMAKGIAGGLSVVAKAAKDLAKSALSAAKGILGIKSPSKEFQKIGAFVTEGFAKGLRGGQGTVTSTLENMTGMLASAMESASRDVENLTSKLNDLQSAETKDSMAIWKTTKALNMARAELKATTAAHRSLGAELADEQAKLKGLGTRYDELTTKLESANQVLADAKRTRDDYNESIKAKYSDLPEFHGKTNLTQYMLKLQAQVKDTNTFTSAVQKLRGLGLNDEVYKEILAKGIEALPFVNQLVDGGAQAVAEINHLSSSLVVTAGSLANQASTALYQAGVDTAQALADGIASQLNTVKSEMERLIEILTKALEEKLRIDAELAKPPPVPRRERSDEERRGNRRRGIGPGKYIDSARDRRNRRGGDGTSDSLKPPIYYKTMPYTGAGGSRRRRGISTRGGYSAAQAAQATSYFSGLAALQRDAKPFSQTFVQNNYSPKALSSAEIYRRTQSQLSRARS